MPSRCVVAGCSKTTKEGVSLHRFPSDQKNRRIWTANVKLTRAKWSGPTEHTMVCSVHFEQTCFDRGLHTQFGMSYKAMLLPDAVPTIFALSKKTAPGKRTDAFVKQERNGTLEDEQLQKKTSKIKQRNEEDARPGCSSSMTSPRLSTTSIPSLDMASSEKDALSGVFHDSSESSCSSSEDESEGSDWHVSDMTIEESSSDSDIPFWPAQRAACGRCTCDKPAAPDHPQLAGQLVAPDGTVWTDQVPQGGGGRSQAANVINVSPGPINVDRDSSQLDLFEKFMPDAMLQLILDHSNAFGRSKRGRQWQNIAMIELRSAIGLLLYLGLTKSGHERERSFWSPGMFSRPVCLSTMSRMRFRNILEMLCFDDRATRQQRKLDDKFAPIREVFEMFVGSCRQYYSPGECLTVDEQLVAFHGRCSFIQHMPKKPAGYGLKFWVCVDSDSHYVCNIQPYIRKEDVELEPELGARVVKDLVQPYYGTGRNVTCNNFFTSADLADHLLNERLTIVGTIKGHRREVPKDMRKESVKGREVKSSRFVFKDDMTLVSFVPKKNQNVTLLSTMHLDDATNPVNRKPYIVEYYNGTKNGVDAVDQMCSVYNCRRKTKRWPMVVFFNLIDLAAINAYVLWLQLNPGWHLKDSSRRHAFLQDIMEGLVGPQIRMRAARPLGMQRPTTLAMTYLGYDVSYQHHLQQQSGDDTPAPTGPCHMCTCERGSRRRRTTRVCSLCHRFICREHSKNRITPSIATCASCIAL